MGSEVKKTGVFTVPGVCRIKTRTKPATKACVKVMFGKETKVKAKPAKTVVNQSLPSCCSEEANLDESGMSVFGTCSWTPRCGNPTVQAWQVLCVSIWQREC